MIPPGDPASSLSQSRRRRELAALKTDPHVDVLVVGGGITGVGIALDAASRGLSTVLVERHDLAHGTSRWSSKLVHGGLRYLASGALDVAYESARERHVLMTAVAPHLIRALPTLIPDYGDRGQALNAIGLHAGDVLRRAAGTARGTLPRARRVDRDTALRMAPGLRSQGLRGAVVGWDGQLEDDARLVVAVARTAAAFGARILTRVEARTVGGTQAELHDGQEGFVLQASNVITATGVWTSELSPQIRLTPSRGAHLVVRSQRLGMPTASLTVPVPEHFGRFVFAMPQRDGLTYIGLTDTPADGLIVDPPVAQNEDILWLLEQISRPLGVPLTTDDVVGTFAGQRPLVAGNDGAQTADLSRRHLVARQPNGVIAVTGGKLTTYRKMAQDAVDLVSGAPCHTTQIALVGAPGNPRSGDRLTRRYGAEAPLVRRLAQTHPVLGQELADGPETGAEIAWAQLMEGALTVDDALHRRTRVGLVPERLTAARAAAERAWAIAELP